MLYPTELRGQCLRKLANKFAFVVIYLAIYNNKCGN